MTDAPVQPMALPAPTPAKDVDALLSYIGPLFIWTMMKHGDNPSYVWHAKNAAGIFVADVIIYAVFQILWTVMPLGILGIFGLTFWVARLVMAAMTLYALWQTWNGRQAVLPVVSGIGQKIPLEKWFHKTAAAAPAPMAAPTSAAAPAPEPMKAPEPAPMPAPTPVAAPEATPPVPMPAPAAPAPAPTPAPEAPKSAEPTPPAAPTV